MRPVVILISACFLFCARVSVAETDAHRAAVKRGVGAALVALGSVGAGASAMALFRVAEERSDGGTCGGPGCADARYLGGGLAGVALSHAAFGAGAALLADGNRAPARPGAKVRSGLVLEIVGGILTAAGGGVLIGGVSVIDRSEGNRLFPLGLAVGGAALAAVGIPLVGYGAYLRPPSRPAPPRIGVQPVFGPHGNGGLVSLSGGF